MKKPKIKLDSQAIQAFLLNHIEKILLVIVVMLMLGLVWRGMTLPHLKDGLAPEKMVNESNQTKQYIEDPDRWNQVSVKPDRQVEFNVVPKVIEVQQKSNPLAYSLPNQWSRPDFPKLSPREDPQLFAPVNLVVRPIVGPLASWYNTYTNADKDPLYPDLTEEEQKKIKDRKRAEDKKKKSSDLSGEYAGSPDGMPGGPGGRTKRGKTRNTEESSMPGSGGRGSRGAPMPGGLSGEYSGGYGASGPLTPGNPYPEVNTFGFPVTST